MCVCMDMVGIRTCLICLDWLECLNQSDVDRSSVCFGSEDFHYQSRLANVISNKLSGVECNPVFTRE